MCIWGVVYLWLLCIWWSGVPELVNCALRCFVPTKRTLWCSLSATKHWKSHFYRAAPGSFNHDFTTFLQSENKFKQTIGCKILILYVHFYILLKQKCIKHFYIVHFSVYSDLSIVYYMLHIVHCILYDVHVHIVQFTSSWQAWVGTQLTEEWHRQLYSGLLPWTEIFWFWWIANVGL